jgi:hypothetical protein
MPPITKLVGPRIVAVQYARVFTVLFFRVFFIVESSRMPF